MELIGKQRCSSDNEHEVVFESLFCHIQYRNVPPTQQNDNTVLIFLYQVHQLSFHKTSKTWHYL